MKQLAQPTRLYKGLFLLNPDAYNQIYGPTQRAAIAQVVDLYAQVFFVAAGVAVAQAADERRQRQEAAGIGEQQQRDCRKE